MHKNLVEHVFSVSLPDGWPVNQPAISSRSFRPFVYNKMYLVFWFKTNTMCYRTECGFVMLNHTSTARCQKTQFATALARPKRWSLSKVHFGFWKRGYRDYISSLTLPLALPRSLYPSPSLNEMRLCACARECFLPYIYMNWTAICAFWFNNLQCGLTVCGSAALLSQDSYTSYVTTTKTVSKILNWISIAKLGAAPSMLHALPSAIARF